jgi:glycyl-tRNA synthetase beta chain
MFALGLQPTGSKDPFALRRQANGIVKTIAEHKLPIGLDQVSADAYESYRGTPAEQRFSTATDYSRTLRGFFRERVEFYLRDVLGFKYDVVNAVLAAGSDDVVDAVARAEAVSRVRGSADFDSISVAFKRIKNILRQASETGTRIAPEPDARAYLELAERNLGAEIPTRALAANLHRQNRDYTSALTEIAGIRPSVDTFFDRVMVMVEDENLRANRLALLNFLLQEFSTIADFSEIVTEGKESAK